MPFRFKIYIPKLTRKGCFIRSKIKIVAKQIQNSKLKFLNHKLVTVCDNSFATEVSYILGGFRYLSYFSQK